MTIDSDNSIRPSSSGLTKAGARRSAVIPGPKDAFMPPARAHENFIPSADSLATLIQSAIAALRNGVFWDRGTILNLLA